MALSVDFPNDKPEISQILVWIEQYLSEKDTLSQEEVTTQILPKLNQAIGFSDRSIIGEYITLLELRAKIYETLGMKEDAEKDRMHIQDYVKQTVNDSVDGYLKAMERPSDENVSNIRTSDVRDRRRGYGSRKK